MKYLALLVLPLALTATQKMPWPMGGQVTREMILKIPRPPGFPSPSSRIFLDHAPWEGVKLPLAPKPFEGEQDDQDDQGTEGPGIVTGE